MSRIYAEAEIHQNHVRGKRPWAPLPLEEKTLLHGQRVSRGRVNPERGCGGLTRSRQTASGRESDCETLLSQRPGHFSKDAVLGRWIRTSRTCRGVGVSQGREELGRHSSLRLPWTTNNFRQLQLRPFIKSPREQGVSRKIMSWEKINKFLCQRNLWMEVLTCCTISQSSCGSQQWGTLVANVPSRHFCKGSFD